MLENILNISDLQFRYERKFVLNDVDYTQVLSLIKIHSYAIKEIYHQRYVNNIYLDDVNLSCYSENVIGSEDRFKVRIRWYGDLFTYVEEPKLEIKIKKGVVGGKQIFTLPSIKIIKNEPNDIHKLFEINILRKTNRSLSKTYRSVDGRPQQATFRI